MPLTRRFDAEILDGDHLPPAEVDRAHRALNLTHTLLGNRAAIVRALRRSPTPIRRVLDVGCGHGALLAHVRAQLSVDVVGVDLRPPANAAVPIVQADATRDPLPEADVAISVCLVHHLADEQVLALIGNVRRCCRRFVLLDLVRHRLPLVLFRLAAPLVLPPVNVADGALSIARAYTPAELNALVRRAVGATPFTHTVALGAIRQIVDITFESS